MAYTIATTTGPHDQLDAADSRTESRTPGAHRVARGRLVKPDEFATSRRASPSCAGGAQEFVNLQNRRFDALPALHPHMATVYRQKVEQLAAALTHDDEAQREAARTALRGFIDAIIVPAGDGLLRVVGNLGEMLTAAGGAAVVESGCGGVQPAVLAALERGGVIDIATLHGIGLGNVV